jgi:hypothetical protein
MYPREEIQNREIVWQMLEEIAEKDVVDAAINNFLERQIAHHDGFDAHGGIVAYIRVGVESDPPPRLKFVDEEAGTCADVQHGGFSSDSTLKKVSDEDAPDFAHRRQLSVGKTVSIKALKDRCEALRRACRNFERHLQADAIGERSSAGESRRSERGDKSFIESQLQRRSNRVRGPGDSHPS